LPVPSFIEDRRHFNIRLDVVMNTALAV
jgi:hypothetical protein